MVTPKWEKMLTIFLFLLLSSTLSLSAPAPATTNATIPTNNTADQDFLFLKKFKLEVDRHSTLNFSTKVPFCKWEGVECDKGRVVRLVLESKSLTGVFAPGSLDRLDQLRVLSLKQNSLSGSIPDLSRLTNLKTLFLCYNAFSGPFPPSLFSLHRLRVLDLSYNKLSGVIPPDITSLPRIYSLLLQGNRFDGSLPPLNQSSLQIFNVSNNLLSGIIPTTTTLSRFNSSSFLGNPELCGPTLSKPCLGAPFFPVTSPVRAPESSSQRQTSEGKVEEKREFRSRKARLVMGLVLAGFFLLLGAIVFFLVRGKKRKEAAEGDSSSRLAPSTVESEKPGRESINRAQQSAEMVRSGKLAFCGGEAQAYALEELLRASAEMLGRGTVGVTYKAVMERQLIVSVKRLDAGCAKLGREEFERRMEALGALRHPNLVPLRAYLQAKEERLLVYEYQPNGSLFSLIHGSRSSRAKPLHWTSCLKIAEDVAQGLSYIHLASKFCHGNLKSTNVLLGADFEARVADYGLTIFLPEHANIDDSVYRPPETAGRPDRRVSTKADIYSYGILILELLAGKMPVRSITASMDLKRWVKAARKEGSEDYTLSSSATTDTTTTTSTTGIGNQKLDMLAEVASECIRPRPDERPTMRQVLRMIQEVKEFDEMEEVDVYN
ncbi:probable inactive receptor kinase At5g67200 [Nymphaea colorata]|nr:probable inactive receptor kinase At5g67200 [Nymphaea colorata]